MESEQLHYESMLQAIKTYSPTVNLAKINDAYHFAAQAHKEQKRKDGSPYIIHPLAVAEIVAEIGLDTDAIAGALLHDTIEDTGVTHDELKKRFGETVADLVDGVTKLTRVQYSTMEEQQMETLRKMFLAMSKDIRVILIKIADRLHNTRTLQYQSPEKQISKSMETMDIYAPLAYRLGIQKIKWELEDISLQYLDPEAYKKLNDYLTSHAEENKTFMQRVQTKIERRLDSVGIKATMSNRIKHIYSIYRKMDKKAKDLDEIYDLYAFRVIVDSIPDCYNVLGHIHDLFNPVPGRFKDYISTPKPNMYQSLHTTVIGSEGIPFEVQIRTWDMHRTAEYGIAAHWKYKQGITSGGEAEFEWVRKLLESQQDTDAEDFIHSMKIDLFDDQVFVFTPRGKVMSLPIGSTPIDFAYAIHSAVGNSMVGAKINGHIAGYDAKLQNGDIVEVLTSKASKGPSRDWLKLCKSNQARIKIKQWYKKERVQENIAMGKQSFEAELRRMSIQPTVLQNEQLQQLLLKRCGVGTMNDLYAEIGYGGLTATKAVNRVQEDLLRLSRAAKAQSVIPAAPAPQNQKARHANSGVIVEDIDSCLIKFSRCCTPVPGDDIVGFITKGYGVSVHRRDCPNAIDATDPSKAGRWVKVSWAETQAGPFSTSFEIDAEDRDGLTLDLATVIASLHVRCSELSCKSAGKGKALAVMTFEVTGLAQLRQIEQKVAAVRGVNAVHRGRT